MRSRVIAVLSLALASATVGCGIARDIAHQWVANLGEWYPDCDDVTKRAMSSCVSSTHDSAQCIDQAQGENWSCNYTVKIKREFKTCMYQVPGLFEPKKNVMCQILFGTQCVPPFVSAEYASQCDVLRIYGVEPWRTKEERK